MKQMLVKGGHMSTTGYREALRRAQRLTPAEQLELLQELAALVRRQVPIEAGQSIMRLQGLGKAVWQGVDAEEYVDQERSSWNG
jgi:hypothetical protein